MSLSERSGSRRYIAALFGVALHDTRIVAALGKIGLFSRHEMSLRREDNLFRSNSSNQSEDKHVWCPQILWLALCLLTMVAATRSSVVWADQKQLEVVIARLSVPRLSASGPDSVIELRIPKSYFRSRQNLEQATSRSGSRSLFLWFLYGTYQGIGPNTSAKYTNAVVPNEGVKLHLRAHREGNYQDEGKRALRARIEAPAQSPSKLLPNPELDLGQGITGYSYARHGKGTKSFAAAFPQADDSLVFVDCDLGRVCIARKTWEGILDVQYSFFYEAFAKDLLSLDAAVNQLLKSFSLQKL